MSGGNYFNLTTPEDFWTLWDADQEVFAAIALADGAKRSGVAALALLVWDILTTLDDEVKLIWPSKWTLPKALYLFVRYWSLITLIFHNVQGIPCTPWLISEILSTFLVELAAELILIFRVYAVYSGKRKILQIMLWGFAVQAVVMAVSLGVSMPQIAAGFYCEAVDLPVEMVLYSTASILYETFLFALMMVGVIGGTKVGYGDTTLLTVLVRDGAFAFVGVFMAMLLNTLLFTLAPTTLVTAGFPWLLAILGAGGSRLVLNVRSTHAKLARTSSTFASSQYPETPLPLHTYSPVHRNESEISSPGGWTEGTESDREDSALNPSRASRGRSTSNPSSRGHSSRGSRNQMYSLARHVAPLLSDVESQSSASPLSPEMRLPR